MIVFVKLSTMNNHVIIYGYHQKKNSNVYSHLPFCFLFISRIVLFFCLIDKVLVFLNTNFGLLFIM